MMESVAFPTEKDITQKIGILLLELVDRII